MTNFIRCPVFVAILAINSAGLALPLPAPLTSALLIKVASFEKHINQKSEITIQVIHDEALAQLLQKNVGQSIASGILINVIASEETVRKQSDIVFVGRVKSIDTILLQTEALNILTVTGDTDFLNRGVVMALYDNEGVPGILLNLSASKKHNLSWNAEILNFAAVLDE